MTGRAKAKDWTGATVGPLTVVARAGSFAGGATWRVRCGCGTEFITSASRLAEGLKGKSLPRCTDCLAITRRAQGRRAARVTGRRFP